MDALSTFRRLREHQNWSARKLLDVAEQLTAEQLLRTFAIGQGSYWATLVHLYGAELVWLEALQGQSAARLPKPQQGLTVGFSPEEITLRSLQEFKTEWLKLMDRWVEYLAHLSSQLLNGAVLRQPTGAKGPPKPTTRADVLLHVPLHAYYTTAQAVNMLRQLGITPLPDTMMISLARSQYPGSADA